MLGAIIGDIVGSRFEFNNHRGKDFEMFGEGCFATDDSIMSNAYPSNWSELLALFGIDHEESEDNDESSN
ncbi:MAG: hypothetical protein ACOX7I_00860 [Oscillospiraceae bacterium]|jgi:hypothetical protein